jgi:hypothetical protein
LYGGRYSSQRKQHKDFLFIYHHSLEFPQGILQQD